MLSPLAVRVEGGTVAADQVYLPDFFRAKKVTRQ